MEKLFRSVEQIFIFTVVLVILVCQGVRWWVGDAGVLNDGIAFSIKLPTPAIYALSIVFLGLITAWFFSTKSLGKNWALWLGLVVGGGASNLIDRWLLSGNVSDYINFFNIGTINLADIAIMTGIILTMFKLIDESSNS